MNNETNLDTELGQALWDVSKETEMKDKYTRERNLFHWKKLDYFWHTIQYLEETQNGFDSPEFNADEYDDIIGFTKCYNVYKSHGESIIAALSVDFPNIIFPPNDAEDPDDKQTSEAFTKISDLLKKQNEGKLLLIKALFTLYNCGIVFGRTYSKADKKYGTYEVPELKTTDSLQCPDCGEQMQGNNCQCGYVGEPITVPIQETDSYRTENKVRQIMEVHGPLNVFIPSWARCKDHITYLRYTEDLPEYDIRYQFKDTGVELTKFSEDTEELEKWARKPFNTTRQERLIPVHHKWFSPCQYYGLKRSEEDTQKLFEDYPDGIHAVYVADQLVILENEDLHDVWAISMDPRSRFVHADPIGRSMVPVQEVINEVFNITVTSIEQGVPLTFADSDVLDFNAYKNSPAIPGQIYPAKSRPGQNLRDSFETLKTATVSQEIEKFADRLEQMGQFVVGSFPSIYGGKLEGSRTAAEYNMSRQQSLQRLSTTWIIVTYFWATFTEISCKGFVNNMKTDERFTKKEGNSYINVWIRRTELLGKIGDVEPEIVEQFPVSSTQKQAMLTQLLEMKSPQIDNVVFHPANRATVARYTGFGELYIPGENDQNKQWEEIDALLKGNATESEMGLNPSVKTDPDIDDALVHIQTCRAFLTSDRGRLIRIENPNGWANVVAHMKMHELDQIGKTAMPTAESQPGEQPNTSATTTGA